MELDWTTLVLEIVNFLVLVWLLKHFFYRPVRAAIERRREAIEADMTSAREKSQRAEELVREREQQLKHWEQEQQQARQKLHAELESERDQRLQAIHTELETEKKRQQSLQQHQQSEQLRQLEQQALQLGGRFASRLLSHFASRDLERLIVQRLLQDLEQLPDEQQQRLRASLNEEGKTIRVSSAFELSDDLQRQLIQVLQLNADRQPLHVEFVVDAELLCGLQIAVDSLLLRANLKQELAYFAGVNNAD